MNKVIKTIIIDDNSSVVSSLNKHYEEINSDIKVVSSFANGEDALKFIINNSYDIDLILMDILVPGIDGISILQEMKSRNIKKKVIVLSSYKDERIISECSDLNVSYYMIKPFSVLALDKRIREIFNTSIKINKLNQSIDMEICELLHNLGIPSHIRGYKYLRDGILIIYNNESVSLVTKEVYPQIAKKYETTASRVERAIRHAIEVSWIRGDLALMEELFGFSVSCEKSKPTNAEFLTTIADRIKLESMAHV